MWNEALDVKISARMNLSYKVLKIYYLEYHACMSIYFKQEISLKKIFGGSQILTILTQLSDEIPLYSLSLHAGKGCSV